MSSYSIMGILQFDLTLRRGQELYEKATKAIFPETAEEHKFEDFTPPPSAVGVLRFNLDQPDGLQAHIRASKSLDLALVLTNISEEIRRRINADLITDEEREAFESFCDFFNEQLDDKGIYLDELIS